MRSSSSIKEEEGEREGEEAGCLESNVIAKGRPDDVLVLSRELGGLER